MTLQDGYSYAPDAIKIYISLDAIFDENSTSPPSILELSFQEVIKLSSIKVSNNYKNSEGAMEYIEEPHSEEESFSNIKEMKYPNLPKKRSER